MANISILIVAPQGANLDSLFAVLPALVPNAEIDHAQDMGDALKIFKEHQPQLALVDCEIGYQWARLIIEMIATQFPAVQIIVLSDATHWQSWREISASHRVLLKGFSTRRLRATLVKALSTLEQASDLLQS